MEKPLMLQYTQSQSRTREEVVESLNNIRTRMHKWEVVLAQWKGKKELAIRHPAFRNAIRNYNALRGVEASHLWFLGYRDSPDY